MFLEIMEAEKRLSENHKPKSHGQEPQPQVVPEVHSESLVVTEEVSSPSRGIADIMTEMVALSARQIKEKVGEIYDAMSTIPNFPVDVSLAQVIQGMDEYTKNLAINKLEELSKHNPVIGLFMAFSTSSEVESSDEVDEDEEVNSEEAVPEETSDVDPTTAEIRSLIHKPIKGRK
jgi:hypothetical protein